MNLEDARKLSPEAQQVLRQRAVAAVVDKGRSQGEVAQEYGVHPHRREPVGATLPETG